MELALTTRRRTRHLGAALGALLAPGDVVWLEGPLGAGKTFFARGLFRALGVPEAIPVTSPTFALVHEHEGRVPIRHLDLYRLGDVDELTELGLDEALDECIVVVEWGAPFRGGIGAPGVEVALSPPTGGKGRVASVRGLDARGEAILAELREDPRVRRMLEDAGEGEGRGLGEG